MYENDVYVMFNVESTVSLSLCLQVALYFLKQFIP